jgi:hypothetical protein
VVAVVAVATLVLDSPTIIIPELLALRMVGTDRVEVVVTELGVVAVVAAKMVVLAVDFLAVITAAILAKTGLV